MGSHQVREPAQRGGPSATPVPMTVLMIALVPMIMIMMLAVVDVSGLVAVWVGHNAQDGRRDASAGVQPPSAEAAERQQSRAGGPCWQARVLRKISAERLAGDSGLRG